MLLVSNRLSRRGMSSERTMLFLWYTSVSVYMLLVWKRKRNFRIKCAYMLLSKWKFKPIFLVFRWVFNVLSWLWRQRIRLWAHGWVLKMYGDFLMFLGVMTFRRFSLIFGFCLVWLITSFLFMILLNFFTYSREIIWSVSISCKAHSFPQNSNVEKIILC